MGWSLSFSLIRDGDMFTCLTSTQQRASVISLGGSSPACTNGANAFGDCGASVYTWTNIPVPCTGLLPLPHICIRMFCLHTPEGPARIAWQIGSSYSASAQEYSRCWIQSCQSPPITSCAELSITLTAELADDISLRHTQFSTTFFVTFTNPHLS